MPGLCSAGFGSKAGNTGGYPLSAGTRHLCCHTVKKRDIPGYLCKVPGVGRLRRETDLQDA